MLLNIKIQQALGKLNNKGKLKLLQCAINLAQKKEYQKTEKKKG